MATAIMAISIAIGVTAEELVVVGPSIVESVVTAEEEVRHID